MFQYTPNIIPRSIILIGCGGTGSRLMPGMAQLVKTMLQKYNPQSWISNLTIYAIDGDVVEPKNLLRQNFIEQDVGQNKAVVLADRYSNAFGVDVFPAPKFLVSDDTYQSLPNQDAREKHITPDTRCFPSPTGSEDLCFLDLLPRSVVIFGVDSATARKDIMRIILGKFSPQDRKSMFIIDAGNEDDFGQVRFFHPVHLGQIREVVEMPRLKLMKDYPVNLIPMDLGYYYDLGESVQEKSCADLPQTLAINAAMAVFILSVLQNFLQIKPFTFDCIRFSLKGQLHSDQCSIMNWAPRLRTNTQAETYFSTGSPLSSKDPVYSQIRSAIEASKETIQKMGASLKSNGEMILPTLTSSAPATAASSEALPTAPLAAKAAPKRKVTKSAAATTPLPPPLTPYNPQENLRPLPPPV